MSTFLWSFATSSHPQLRLQFFRRTKIGQLNKPVLENTFIYACFLVNYFAVRKNGTGTHSTFLNSTTKIKQKQSREIKTRAKHNQSKQIKQRQQQFSSGSFPFYLRLITHDFSPPENWNCSSFVYGYINTKTWTLQFFHNILLQNLPFQFTIYLLSVWNDSEGSNYSIIWRFTRFFIKYPNIYTVIFFVK